jgi:uncharacterized protein (TIGR02001 family)
LAAIVAASVLSGGAYAADLTKVAPPPAAPASTDGFDYAFGGKLQTDYISRGITQTDHQPGATAYGELRYNLGDTQFYVGNQDWSVKLPTAPAAEVDLYGGVRQTWGPVTVDVGGIYYYYPGNTLQYETTGGVGSFSCLAQFNCGTPTTAADPSYFELYAKPSWTVNDTLTVGGNLYWSPNWNNYGHGTNETYLSGTAKVSLPSNFSISGEFGHEFLGTSSITYGPTVFVSYNTWNLGVSYAYNVFTFDLRYYGTDLSSTNCWIDSSDPHGNVPGAGASDKSNWCGQRVMASLSLDLTSANLVKK